MREILVTVSAGFFGAMGSGLLACVAGPLFRGRGARAPATGGRGSLLVLIPAHNEALTLAETLKSVRVAAGAGARIIVGADQCSDSTEAIARAGGAEVIQVSFRSKWKTLATMAKLAESGDWVALVDSGAVWPASLFSDLDPILADPATMALAPAYFPRNASRLERLLWQVEAFWKRGENRAGGPVSTHGATVFYRAEVLSAAFKYLERFGREQWLNDDIALPFAARILFPGSYLRYWCPSDVNRRISDSGLREDVPQAARRRRMVAGNLEWALTLFPAALLASPGSALVALRRVLRIFWAYWMVLVLYGFALAAFPARGSALLAAMACAMGLGVFLAAAGKRGILDAALASILAPFLAFSVWRGRARAWG
ncbi:MAG: glycosyltransferase family 2 protein [Bdellovibrionota bacterium]